MSANLRYCARNMADEATIAATSAEVTLPASNLKLTTRARVWRSTSAAAQNIDLHWNGNVGRFNFVRLERHNLENDATWRILAYPNADWTGTPVYDSGTLDAYDAATLGELDWGFEPLGSSIFDSFLGQKFSQHYCGAGGVPGAVLTTYNPLSMRITVTDTGNSAGYVQASRLYIGRALELTYNPDSCTFAWMEDTKQARSSGGTLRSDGLNTFRQISVGLGIITEAQRAELADAVRFAGMRKDWMLDVYPDASGERARDYSMVGRLVSSPQFTERGGFVDFHSSGLVLQEI